MQKQFKIYMADDVMNDGIAVMLRTVSTDMPIQPLEFTVNSEAKKGYYYEPTMRLNRHEAQEFMQELWRLGYRPNSGESTVAHVEALKYHLEDMRKLAFKKK